MRLQLGSIAGAVVLAALAAPARADDRAEVSTSLFAEQRAGGKGGLTVIHPQADFDIDLGRFENGKHFAIAAGVGIDASMVAETPVWMKRRLGILGYALVATRAALKAVQ